MRAGVGHIEVRRGSFFEPLPPTTAPALFPDVVPTIVLTPTTLGAAPTAVPAEAQP